MGTRSLVHIKLDGLESRTLVTIYRQYDGYPEGLCNRLWQILNNGKTEILNGYGSDSIPSAFNGMGCMSAWIIKELKAQIGNVYIYPIDSKDVGEEWTYTIFLEGDELKLIVEGYDKYKQFDITPSGYEEFSAWLNNYHIEEE